MAEKRRPHYVLTEVKRLIRYAESRRITRSALNGAAALGLTDEDIVACGKIVVVISFKAL